jgi:hypothetical protein
VYIPEIIPPTSAPSETFLPKSRYPPTTATTTDKKPLMQTFSCSDNSLREKLHPKSIIGIASGTITFGSSACNESISVGSVKIFPTAIPIAYSNIIGPIVPSHE